MPYKDSQKAVERKRRYYERNRQACIERARQQRLRDPEADNEYHRKRYAQQIERLRPINASKMKKWRRANPDRAAKNRAADRKRIRAAPERYRHYLDRKRAFGRTAKGKACKRREYLKHRAAYTRRVEERKVRELGASGSHTIAQWMARVEFYGWQCFYCGKGLSPSTLTKDHRIALSKGGTDFASNLVPACKSCNCSKRDRKAPLLPASGEATGV